MVSNDLATDARVLRHANTLQKEGYSVTVWGRNHKNQPLGREWQDISTRRFRLWFNRGPLFYLNLNAVFLFYGTFTSFDVVVANDSDTLLAATALKLDNKKQMVFDAHEYFTEVPELVHRPRIQKIWAWIEGQCIPHTDAAFSVAHSIAQRYSQEFGVDFKVVRNMSQPLLGEPTPLPQLPQDFLIYQGVLNVGRGIELMIAAMELLPHLHLVIAGDGDIKKALVQQAEETAYAHRIHFLGRVTPAQLQQITPKAQLGLSLEEDMGYNYRMALPNKIFSYLHAGIPTVCSQLPEMAKLVGDHDIGTVLKKRTPESLAAVMAATLSKRESYLPAIKKAQQELHWDKEAQQLISIFRAL